MALIDPPQYVAVPPVLIYGCEDVERELYKALLQVVGWLWVTKKHGGDLTTTTTELGERWGVAERTVYDRLQRLGEMGYLSVRVVRSRVYIRLGEKARGQVGGQPSARTGASSLHGASRLHGAGVDPTNVCSSSDLDLDRDLDDHETTTTLLDEDVFKLLRLRGVHPRAAEELAGDRWVTEEQVEGWWADLMRQEREAPGRIRDPGAVLAANLRDHYEAPGTRRIDRMRRG